MTGLSNTSAGLLISLVSMVGLFGNILLLYVCMKQKLYASPIYFLIMSLGVNDCIVNFIQILQDGTSILLGRLVIEGTWNRALGWLFVHCFQLHVTQVVFITVLQALFLYWAAWAEKFLTNQRAAVIVFILWLFPLWQTLFMLPVYPFSDMTNMSFLPEARSWYFNMTYPFAQPLNSASGAYLLLCFVVGSLASVCILFKIWAARKKLVLGLMNQTKSNEIKRLSIQFVSTLSLFLLQSILFYTLPNYFLDNPNVMFILTISNPILFGSNFFIYIFVNRSFRNGFTKSFKTNNTIFATEMIKTQ